VRLAWNELSADGSSYKLVYPGTVVVMSLLASLVRRAGVGGSQVPSARTLPCVLPARSFASKDAKKDAKKAAKATSKKKKTMDRAVGDGRTLSLSRETLAIFRCTAR
jgi:hypothetical protein